MTVDLLQSPAATKPFDSPAGGPRNAPPSPALSREQIKNRSSRGWSSSNGSAQQPPSTTSQLSIPPFNFRSKSPSHPAASSAAMGRTTSSESTSSIINNTAAMSPLDAGSPFGNILGQFQSPQVDSARKASGSFKVLDKKAVSNSPFLTGGNTRSATGANYSPASTTLAGAASPRKPFAPASGFASWRNGPDSNSNPPSPARSGLHGLGVFSSTTTSSSPVQTTAPFLPSHRRNNSDVENRYPEYDDTASEVLGRSLKPIQKAVKPDVSPATQFNAEMESLGQPRALDITRGRSDSDASSADLLPQLHTSIGNGARPTSDSQARSGRKPRPSVATLGHRATVSNSPFLSQGGPLSPGLASTLRHGGEARDAPLASQLPFPQPPSALSSQPRRNLLGPREPSLTDLKAKAEEQDILSEYYNDDEPLNPLTAHTLERKASKKSVKWAEMEEVCEYDVMTEDGDSSSRRSSSTGCYDANEDYGDSSYDIDVEETKAQVQEILRQHGVQDLNVFGNEERESPDAFYDQTQHVSVGKHSSEEEDMTISRSRQTTVKPEHLSRDASFMSEQASVIDMPEADNSASSFDERDGEAEIQQLIDQVEAASMTGRPQRLEDVFGSPFRQDEFGMRTPHSSMGAESNISSALGTPQPLNRNGSLSRRPLPSPPTIALGSKSPAGSPSKSSERSRGDSTERNSFMMQSSTADDSLFSLPDLGLGSDAIFDLKEMGLSRKESMKRSPGIHCYNGPATASTAFKPSLQDHKEELLPAADLLERSISPKPFLTAEDVRNSLRKKPSILSQLQEAPLASTPPTGGSITSTSNLPPPPTRQIFDTGSTSTARNPGNKAISARPAPQPIKISSDQLPTFNTSTPQPSPTKEPESALDRLVREAAAGNAEAVHALKGDWAQAYSASAAKDAAAQREEAILAAKRATKGLSISAGPGGRVKHRRSLSAGDVSTDSIEEEEHVIQPLTPRREETPSLQNKARRAQTAPNSAGASKLAGEGAKMDRENGFSSQLGQALDNVVDFHDRGYRVREQSRGVLAYDGSTSHRISTVGNAGDVDAGGAWRKIRRPSDIFEHRTQIREYKQASASKARNTGALFVKIGKLRVGRDLPIPQEPTFVACELFNGLDHVTTGVSRLSAETEIQQEFELIAHPNLEVTLAFKVRKDPSKDRHLFPRPNSVTPASPSSKHVHTGSTSGFRNGLRNLLSSPKKNKIRPASAMDIRAASPSPSFPAHPLLDYLSADGELCRLSFKSETFLPSCTGKRIKTVHQCRAPDCSRRIAGSPFELEVSLFYLPPLPSVPVDKLPQSIEECIDGLLKAERHDKMLFQGILTQMGADCTIWRRRWFTLKGSRLIAYNEVTRQAHAVFDLAQAVKLDDPDEETPSTPANSVATPATASTGRNSIFKDSQHKRTLSFEDDEDPFSTRPNSFRIHFEDGTFIDLCADADKPEEKAKWLVYLKPIINRDKKMRGFGTPPVWAQTLREMLDAKAKKESSSDKPPLPRK